MIKKLSIGLLYLTTALLAIKVMNIDNKYKIKIGVYDPSGTYDTVPYVEILSEYFSWTDEIRLFSNFIDKTTKLGKTPMVTIEPWGSADHKTNSHNLMDRILQGKYDTSIIKICEELRQYDGPIYIRWGHEMELNNDRYPWSGGDGDKYIDAYRHFVDICRTNSNTNFSFVWSPAGEENLDTYWPGNSYVDYIGLSVYSFKEWEEENNGYQRDLIDIFDQRYERVKKYEKPIIIAEMGYTGSDEEKNKQLEKFSKELGRYPLLEALIYFNSVDVEGVWGWDVDTPMWGINSDALTPFYSHTNLYQDENR